MSKKYLAIFISSFALMSSLTGCASKTTYEVKLNAGVGIFYGGIKTITISDVKGGTKLSDIAEYETPTKENYFFDCWTTNEGKKISEDYIIGKDLDLTANFDALSTTYTVTLDANGGYFSNGKEDKSIQGVTTLTNSICEIPSHDDEGNVSYYFLAWYYDEECTNLVTFNKKLTEDIVIYAGWSKETSKTFELKDSSGTPITPSEGIYTINASDTYTITGKATNSQILINDKNIKATLILNGATLYSSTLKTAINIKKADEVTIQIADDTSNYIFDKRGNGTTVLEDEDGAINAKCDLKIKGGNKGTGVLYINDIDKAPGYSRAIHTSKELKIKDTNVIAYSIDTTIKAKQGIEIEDSSLRLISKTGDGLKTDDIDLSSKGNRRGDINIIGASSLNIYSAQDAIDASHDVNIESDENGNEPHINISTSKFSSYTGDVTVDKRDFYMRASYSPNTHYDPSKYWCAIYCSETEEWEQVKLKKTIAGAYGSNPLPPSEGTSGYYYSFSLDNSISKFAVYLFEVNQIEASTNNYFAMSEEINVPTSTNRYDTLGSNNSYVTFPTTKGTLITGTTFGGTYNNLVGTDGHSCGVDYSNKGIKADNEITINAGDINIQSYDDSLHTSHGLFYPGLNDGTGFEVGTGNININGGNINIASGNSTSNGDDAIHSAGILSIAGGNINIAHSYEGIEAGIINISGGTTKLYAYDDGANATNQGNIINPDINITGGTLDITVASGDTDGIDSNGTYNQSGGVVVTRGDPSARAMSTGLDTNKGASITGGALLCLGKKPESTPSCGQDVVLNSNLTEASKTSTHTLKIGNSISYMFTNNSSYGGAYLYYLSTLGEPSVL